MQSVSPVSSTLPRAVSERLLSVISADTYNLDVEVQVTYQDLNLGPNVTER